MFLNNITDVHDVEGVLLVPRIDYSPDDVHVVHSVVEDFQLVEIVQRHVSADDAN